LGKDEIEDQGASLDTEADESDPGNHLKEFDEDICS
jgi:hypothetical protein